MYAILYEQKSFAENGSLTRWNSKWQPPNVENGGKCEASSIRFSRERDALSL